MSTTIDQRVVEMKFDNKHFESNVSTTMSTLDKLKQKLNFKGAADSLENINTASKKINMSGLGNAVETVHAKFSALEVIGVTALANITNSAVNAGKKMISALTIDPITTGFQEYETQINAVQTILANTSSKGTTIDQVNDALEKLNKYADMTIYNFTEMTRNIGTFTAAGVDLETSVSAIQGIANLAAVSGSTSQQASTAMYQLSQALSSGTVKLMDWNSVVNAGMGGEVFQNALKQTARIHGVAIDEMIEKQGSFRETLSEGWLTSDILTETLNQFTMAAEEGTEQWEAYKKSLKEKGYTEEQAIEILKMANTATDAATKVKTFTQLWDVLKEAAQSGWSQTWKTVVGDFEESKAVLTPLADVLTGFINKMSDARNFVVEGVMDFAKPWTSISEKLEKAGLTVTKTMDSISDAGDKLLINNAVSKKITKIKKTVDDATKTVEYFQNVVNKVWMGDYKTSDTGRFEMLDAEGYNHKVVQDLVNLGYGYKLTIEDIEASHKKFGVSLETTADSAENVKMVFAALSDEQLRNAGLTEDEIRLFRDLAAESERTGKSINTIAKEMSEFNGRAVLIDSLKNIGKGLIDVFTAIGKAWKNVFDPVSIVGIYNAIKGFKEFTEGLRLVDETTGKFTATGEKVQRVFEGIFAAVNIVTTIVGGGLKFAFNILTEILSHFGIGILDVAAGIADAIVWLNNWIDSIFDAGKAAETLIDWFKKIGESEAFKTIEKWFKTSKIAIVDWFKAFGESGEFDKFKNKLEEVKTSIKDWFKNLKNMSPREIAESIVNGIGSAISYIGELFGALKDVVMGKVDDIPDGVISGFVNGLKDGAVKVGQVIVELGKILVEKIKDYLGIHSPSTVFFAIGGFIIAGLVGGLLAGSGDVLQSIKDIGAKCVEYISAIDFGAIFAAAITTGIVAIGWKVSNALEAFASPFEGIGDILENAADTVKIFNKSLKSMSKSISFGIKAEAIKSIAIALGILVAAVIALTFFKPEDLLASVGIMAAIAVVLGALAKAIDMFNASAVDVAKVAATLLSLSAAMLIFAAVIKIMGGMTDEGMDRASEGLIGLASIIAVLVGTTQFAGKDIDKVGGTLLKIAIAMALLAVVAKVIAGMTWPEMGKAGAGLAGLGGIVTGLIAATKLAGKDIDKVGGTILAISAAMLLLTITAKIIAGMTWTEMGKAAAGLVGLGGIVKGLIAATKLAGTNLDKVGTTILAISAAMLLLTITAQIIAGMEWEELGKAAVGLVGLGGIITGLIAATKLAGKDLDKVGTTLLAISAAIAILAGVAVLLGMMDLDNLAKGVGAVAVLGLIMAELIRATKDAQACKGNLIAITVAIGIMAIAVAGLSFLDGTKLAGATAALGILMAIFAGLIAATKLASGSMSTLIVMTVAVGVLAGVIALLTKLDVEKALDASVALSLLLTAMSASLLLISKAGATATSAIGALALMGVVVAELAVILGVLAYLDVNPSIETVAALSIMLGAMSACLVLLNLVGPNAASGVGCLALLGLVIGEMAVILGLMAHFDVNPSIETATALSILLTSMSASLLILAAVGATGPAALVGIGSLAALITGIGGLIVGIGYLQENVVDLEKFLDTGIPVIEKIGYALGAFGGNIIGGFASGLTSGLPKMAEDLSAFTNRLKDIDSKAVDGAKSMAEIILVLTAANVLDRLTFGFTGGSSISKFADEIIPFGNAMKDFSAAVSGNIDEGAVTAAANAGKILAEMAATIPNAGGIASWFAGENDMTTFSKQITSFGFAIKSFSQIVSGNIDEDAVTSAANAGKVLAEMASAVPNMGGVASWFAGENDMTAFGEQLKSFGSAIVSFSSAVAGNVDEQAIEAAANAGMIMTEMASTIPNVGGVASWFAGENDLAEFGQKLTSFGFAIKSFSQIVSGNIDEDAVASAANAGTIMSELAASIPNSGGLVSLFTGDNDLAMFGSQMVYFGRAMANFSSEVAGKIDESSVSAATSAGMALAALANTIPDSGGMKSLFAGDNDFETFGKNIVSLGKSLASYGEEVSGIDTSKFSSAMTEFKRFKDLALGISGVDFEGVKSFSKSLKSIGESGVDGFIEAFEGAGKEVTSACTTLINSAKKAFTDKQSAFQEAGTTLINKLTDGLSKSKNNATNSVTKLLNDICKVIKDKYKDFETLGKNVVVKFANGMTDKKATASKSVETMMSDVVSALDGYYSDFYDAASYLVDGFAAGISENTFKATAKATAMARAALEAAEEELDENSPSKEFYRIGDFAGQGFVNALGDYANASYRAGTEMAAASKDGLREVLNQTSKVFSSDVDVTPTIRPVLDLSDVKNGAANIGNMLNLNPSVGLATNISAVNTMMNRRVQNGGNSDIVSAINKLHDGFDKVGNTSYTIEGITYDDGSNIADAVRTLVRAAKVERRN